MLTFNSTTQRKIIFLLYLGVFLPSARNTRLLKIPEKMPGNYNIPLNNREITLYDLECCSRKLNCKPHIYIRPKKVGMNDCNNILCVLVSRETAKKYFRCPKKVLHLYSIHVCVVATSVNPSMPCHARDVYYM